MRVVFAALTKECSKSSKEITNRDTPNTADDTELKVNADETRDSSNNAVDSEMDDNNIMDKLNFLVEDYLKLHRRLSALAKTAKDQTERDQTLEKELEELITLINENQVRD